MCDAGGNCGSCSGTASVPGGGKILAYNIKMNGFGILYSFAELPSYAYTAGIEEGRHHPEIILFGLDYDSSTRMITEAFGLIKEGTTFTDPDISYEINGIKAKFREVSSVRAAQYLCETAAYYGDKHFRVLQLLWPDEHGHFPYEAECTEETKRVQPLL